MIWKVLLSIVREWLKNLPRRPELEPKTLQVIVRPRNEIEAEAIRYFRKVCRRDEIDMIDEFVKMIEHYWKKLHPPPGNPQHMMDKFFKEPEPKNRTIMCDVLGCPEPAIFNCETVFPFGRHKQYCRNHTFWCERRNEIIKKTKI